MPEVDSWWSRRRILAAVATALVIATFAFLYRFNALGGALAGFDNDHFTRLARAEMLLQGEEPLRDFVDAELRGAWPALTYRLSAWAQQIGGRTLLPEAYLMAGLLTLAHVIVFFVALEISRRWSVAVLAALTAMMTTPKLHNYTKVISLALGVWAMCAVVRKPSVQRLAAAAFVTAIAVAFRHDYGVYVAAGMVAALIARDPLKWRDAARHLAIYGGLTAIFLLPSAISVQRYVGIPAYWRNALVTVAAEETRTPLALGTFDPGSALTHDGAEVLSYYAFWAVPVAAALTLAAFLFTPPGRRLRADDRATAFGLLAMTLIVNRFFLRANLAERFGDAVVPVVVLAACVAGTAYAWRSAAVRRALVVIPVALLLPMLVAAYVYSDTAHDLDTSGLSDSVGKTIRRFRAVNAELGRLPPAVWSDQDAQGTLVAARYVAECTAPQDYLLVLGAIHEIPVYAHRRFAAGQAVFKLSLYTSEADQRRAVARLERQSVPIIVADNDFDGGFKSDYPLVAAYIAAHYRETGPILVDEDTKVHVLVATNRKPVRTDPHLGLPCFE